MVIFGAFPFWLDYCFLDNQLLNRVFTALTRVPIIELKISESNRLFEGQSNHFYKVSIPRKFFGIKLPLCMYENEKR